MDKEYLFAQQQRAWDKGDDTRRLGSDTVSGFLEEILPASERGERKEMGKGHEVHLKFSVR